MRRSLALATFCLLFIATACTIQLISPYDEAIDKGATDLQKKVDTFLLTLQRTAGTDAAKYEQHTEFYDDVRSDIGVLRTRAAAHPKNNITISSLDEFAKNIDLLETAHEGGIKANEIPVMMTALDTQLAAIVKLEVAKKRGATKE